ncbi:MAG: hypothetical protein OXE52_10875 [Chloroflexi bacterium]|nr:hypothetical protein [Chloroflexota bacterium]
MHPNDRRRIVLTFRRLIKSGVEYNPEHVHEWLLNDGWSEAPAMEAKQIAEYEQDFAMVEDFLESAIDHWRDIGGENM